MRTASAVLLVGCATGGVGAFIAPSSWSRSVGSINHAPLSRLHLYLDTDGPNGHQIVPAAATDPEIFQRALLEERLRLEGRLPPRKNNDELLHRALLKTRLDMEAAEKRRVMMGSAPGKPTPSMLDKDELLHRALLKTRLEIEAREKQSPTVMVESAPLKPTQTVDNKEEHLHRALLQTRLKMEAREKQIQEVMIGSASAKPTQVVGDKEELLHRALLQTRLEIEGRQKQSASDVEVIVDASPRGEELYKALDEATLAREAKARESTLILEKSPPSSSLDEVLLSNTHQVTVLDKLPETQEAEELLLSMLDSRRFEMDSRPNMAPVSNVAVDTDLEQGMKTMDAKSNVLQGKAAETTTYTSFANQRALLEARLMLEAKARAAAANKIVTEAAEEDQFPSPIDTSFAFQRALLETRLAMEAKARRASSKLRSSVQSPATVEKKETTVTENKPLIAATSRNDDSSFLSQRALLETRVAPEDKDKTKANVRNEDVATVTNESHSPAMAADGAPQSSEPVQVEPVPIKEDKVTTNPGQVPVTEALVLKPKKVKESYWKKISAKDVSSSIIKTFTPDKGIKELQEETDEELVGFAASRLLKGVIKGGKAAFLGLESAFTPEPSPELVVEAVADSTQSFVSAAAALATFGWRQGLRAGKYAKMELEKMETERALQKERQLEAERRECEAIIESIRKEKEAIRVAAETKRKEESLAAEEKLEEERMIAESQLEGSEAFFADTVSF